MKYYEGEGVETNVSAPAALHPMRDAQPMWHLAGLGFLAVCAVVAMGVLTALAIVAAFALRTSLR